MDAYQPKPPALLTALETYVRQQIIPAWMIGYFILKFCNYIHLAN
jgi:hypothetical protein